MFSTRVLFKMFPILPRSLYHSDTSSLEDIKTMFVGEKVKITIKQPQFHDKEAEVIEGKCIEIYYVTIAFRRKKIVFVVRNRHFRFESFVFRGCIVKGDYTHGGTITVKKVENPS